MSLGAWEGVVRWQGIPPYILPGPILIARTVVADWGTLFPPLLVTLAITAAAFVISAVLGLALAVLFTQSASPGRLASNPVIWMASVAVGSPAVALALKASIFFLASGV